MTKAQKAAMRLRGEVEAWAYPANWMMEFASETVPVWEDGRIKLYAIANKGKLILVHSKKYSAWYENGRKLGEFMPADGIVDEANLERIMKRQRMRKSVKATWLPGK